MSQSIADEIDDDTDYRGDWYDILSRRTEITLPSTERRGSYTPVIEIGQTGGIRHAVAPLPRWLLVGALIGGIALATVLLVVCVVALGSAIAVGLDLAFYTLGQWSAA